MTSAHFGPMDVFAQNLKRRAAELGVSNSEVARRLGVSERRYAHYTRGDREPDLATLVRIAVLFGCTTDELLGIGPAPSGSELEELNQRLATIAGHLADRDLSVLIATASAMSLASLPGSAEDAG